MQKIIAIDVDSVCADIMVPWLARYNKEYNDNLDVEDISEWDTSKFVKPECGKSCYKYFGDPGIYEEALPIQGAQEGVMRLREMDWRVVFPTTVTPGTEGCKKKWLYRYGFLLPEEEKGYKDYIEVSDKTLVKASYLLDDSWDNCWAFSYIGPERGIVFDQPWNRQNSSLLMRVHGWTSFIDLVENVLNKP
jgi:5'-nucleotidase